MFQVGWWTPSCASAQEKLDKVRKLLVGGCFRHCISHSKQHCSPETSKTNISGSVFFYKQKKPAFWAPVSGVMQASVNMTSEAKGGETLRVEVEEMEIPVGVNPPSTKLPFLPCLERSKSAGGDILDTSSLFPVKQGIHGGSCSSMKSSNLQAPAEDMSV